MNRLTAVVARNQLQELSLRNCGIERFSSKLFFDSLEKLGCRMACLQRVSGISDEKKLNLLFL